jgi:hypothetical protein
MKTNLTAEESGWRVSFWFAISSPLIGVLLAFLAGRFFVDDGGRHELGINHLRLGDSPVRFRFGRKIKTRRKHNYRLQQINLVAFKKIPRASHQRKE